MPSNQIAAEVDVASSNLTPKILVRKSPRRKKSLKDSWWVLVLVPLVVALVPLLNTLLGTKHPEGHDRIQNNNFSGDMYFANVSLINQQYQQTTGRPLNDRDLKKIEDAGRFAARNNFVAAASILSDVAQSVRVAAVYNNLGVAYANSKHDLGPAEEAFRQAVAKDPNYEAAWVHLGLVQRKEGKLEDALASFLKAPDLAARQITDIGEELKPKPTPPPSGPPDQNGAAQQIKPSSDGHDILSAKPVALEAARQDAIAPDKANYFRFVTPPKYRDWVTISMTNRSTTLEPWLKVFNADKSDLSGNQYNTTQGANLEYNFAAEPNSTYYVAVSGFGSTAGDYTLLVKPAKAYDRYEPNDDILHASPIDFGKPIEANIMDAKDVDYYQFRSPGRAGNVEISIANRSTTLEPWLKVFNADKSDISGNQYNTTSGGNLTYSFAAQPNSTYYIAVSGFGSTAGNYTLTMRLR